MNSGLIMLMLINAKIGFGYFKQFHNYKIKNNSILTFYIFRILKIINEIFKSTLFTKYEY